MWRSILVGAMAFVATSVMSAQAANLPILGPGGSAFILPGESYEITDLTSPFGGVTAVPTGVNGQGQLVVLDQYQLFVLDDGIPGFDPLVFQFSAQDAFGNSDPVGLGDLTFTVTDTNLGTTLSAITLTDATGFLFPDVLTSFVLDGPSFGLLDITLTVAATILAPGSSYSATISPLAVPIPAPFGFLLASIIGLAFLRRRRGIA